MNDDLRLTNSYGHASLGNIRQVSFRPDSIGHFMRELYDTDPAFFAQRIANAANNVATGWREQVIDNDEEIEITVEYWAKNDSWAGLGRIITQNISNKKYIIRVSDPFTVNWGSEAEIYFWEGYLTGIFE